MRMRRVSKLRISCRDDGVQLARHPCAQQREVGHQRQALAGAVIDHRQVAEATTVSQLVGDEVQRPALNWRPARSQLLFPSVPQYKIPPVPG